LPCVCAVTLPWGWSYKRCGPACRGWHPPGSSM